MSHASRTGKDPGWRSPRWAALGLVVALVLLGAAPASAGENVTGKAPEPASARAALERFDAALEKEEGLNPDTKSALKDLLGALDVAAPASTQGSSAPPPAPDTNRLWEGLLERVHPFGDARMREEYNFHLDDMVDNNRLRVRLRGGAAIDVADDVEVGFRIVSGDPDDPNSPHQTLGNVFNAYDWNFDRVYVKYAPSAVPGLFVQGGKFKHPFYRNPVYGAIVWDSDVQPEGFLAGWALEDREFLKDIMVYVGEYILAQKFGGKESWATVMQVKTGLNVSDDVAIHYALANYIYHDLDPDGSLFIAADNAGNELDPAGDFAHDFWTVHQILALTFGLGDLPLTTAFEFAFNARTGDNDLMWGMGAAVGQNQNQGDWRVYYNFAVVQQNSILSVVAGDDLLIPVNSRNHATGASYRITDNIWLHLWCLVSQRISTELVPGFDSRMWQYRTRFDINIAF